MVEYRLQGSTGFVSRQTDTPVPHREAMTEVRQVKNLKGALEISLVDVSNEDNHPRFVKGWRREDVSSHWTPET
jgi:hypothetical protein